MNPDPFEHRLARQPLKPVPPEWRDEILARARDVQSPATFQPSAFNLQPSWLERLFGPNPLAWAGLAAVWLVLFAVNRSASEPAGGASVASLATEPTQAEVAEIVRERRREMAELLNLDEPKAALPSRPESPPKRSQRREDFAVV